MPAKKAKSKKKRSALRRKFNLKDGGRPLQAIVTGLERVIKSGDNTAKAIRVKAQVEAVIKTLSGICDANRWTCDT